MSIVSFIFSVEDGVDTLAGYAEEVADLLVGPALFVEVSHCLCVLIVAREGEAFCDKGAVGSDLFFTLEDVVWGARTAVASVAAAAKVLCVDLRCSTERAGSDLALVVVVGNGAVFKATKASVKAFEERERQEVRLWDFSDFAVLGYALEDVVRQKFSGGKLAKTAADYFVVIKFFHFYLL